MQVELASFDGIRGEFEHLYQPGEFLLNDERVRLIRPPRVSGRIKRDGNKIRVSGRVESHAQLECDRCLQTIELPIETQFSLEYVTSDEYNRLHGAELSEEDLTLSVFDGEIIDIDELVREQVLLAVPSHTLCTESCKGLCPICGKNRNLADCGCEETEIDPRWAELKKLK